MTKREKLIWCIFGAILGVLFLLSFTDLIIKEKKAEIYPISVVLDSTTDECYANFKKGVEQAARELGYHLPGRKNRKESRKAEKKLADAKEENTTRYNVVMDSVNLEEVRDRAINDLGMGYATSDQIIEYQNPVNDYVKQYESIPKSGVLGQTTDK